MPVFISHRTEDDRQAKLVYHHLHGIHGIPCYLDDFDPDADPTDRITDTIVTALEKSTHLLALITNNTKGSWWVPFEIGVARHGARRITSLDRSNGPLPEYLQEWPVLQEWDHLAVFAHLYKADTQAPLIRKGLRMDETTLHRQEAAATKFHATLKTRLETL